MKSERKKKGPSASNMRVYETICDFIAEHGYPPTLIEVAEIMDCNFVNVKEHVERLRDMGYLIVPPKERMQRMLIPTKREADDGEA